MKNSRLKKLLSLLLTLVMLISCVPFAAFAEDVTPTEPTPIFANGGFETGDFTSYSFQSGADNVYSINSDSANVRSGAYSLKIEDYTEDDGTVTDSKWKSIIQKFDVEANTDYVLTYFVKSDNHNGAINAKIADTGWQVISSAVSSKNNYNGDWYLNEVRFNSGNRTKIMVMLAHNVDNVVSSYIDDISVVKATQKGLVVNGSFESGDLSGFTESTGVIAEVSNDKAHTGDYSLKFSPNPNKYVSVSLSVEKNTDYVVTYYDYNDKNFISCRIYTSNWATVIKADAQHSGGTGWRLNRVQFNSGENTKIVIALSNTKTAGSTNITYIDDIAINKATAENANLIDNGGFESGSVDDGWSYPVANAANFTINSDSQYVHSGNHSLKLVGVSGSKRMVQTRIVVEKNTDYVLSYWAYDATSNLIFEFYDTSGTETRITNYSNHQAAGALGWRKNYVTFNSGDTTVINIKFYYTSTSRDCYVDDMYLAKAIPVDAYTGEGGTAVVDAAAVTAVPYGDTVTFTATADSSYAFEGWYDGEALVSNEAVYSPIITEEKYLTAQFGAIKKSEIVNYDFETATTVSLIEDFGYLMGNKLDDDTRDYADIVDTHYHTGNQSLKVGKEDIASLTSKFTDKFVTIPFNVTPDTEYTIRFWSKKEGTGNASVARVTTANWSGVKIVGDFNVAVGNEDSWGLNTKTFNSGSYTKLYLQLVVDGAAITYIDDIGVAVAVTATANATTGGSVNTVNQYGQTSETADVTYLYGDDVTVTATADDYYVFTGWTLGDEIVSTNASYTYNIKDNTTVEAIFAFDGKGDLDGDGWFYATDLTALRKILLGLELDFEYSQAGADLNGDGVINIKDCVSLKKRLASGVQSEVF